MTNAWLIRPVPHGTNRLHEFKEKGFIAVGWPGIGNLAGKSREDLKLLLSKPPYNLNSLALGNTYATLDIFVNQMNINDFILMPDGSDIYLGQLTGSYHYDSTVDNDQTGYPHQRTVKWLSHTVRENLSMNLRSALKVHRTAANLSTHANEIDALCKGKKFTDMTPQKKDFIEVSYPLRTDFEITFKIPKDISLEEAQRLSSYFATLYFTK